MIKVRLAGTDGTALRAGRIRNCSQKTDGAGEPDRIPVTVGDPDNDIDPDGRAPTVNDPPPPSMPPSWWIRMVLGDSDVPVDPEDIKLVFRHVERRLVDREASTGTFPPSQDATAECLLPSEAGDSGPTQSSATVGLELNSITTVGQLHERVEELFGPPGWAVFIELWQEAAGIQQPRRQQKLDRAPILAVEPDRKPDAPLPPLPANAPLLEEGLHRELPGMPERVAAFLSHVPRDPPVWRYQESAGERLERQALEHIGGWTG